MPTIINSVISLFLIMLVGVYGSKKGIISDTVNKGLSSILLQITLPCMVIASFGLTYDEAIRSNVAKAFYYSFIVYIIMIISSKLLMMPVKNERRTIMHFSNIFTNTGFIGFPILNVIYGPEAVMYGSIFNVFFNIFIWTYGIIIFKGKMEKEELIKELIKALKNPSLIAVYIGITMMLLNIKLPDVIFKSVSLVGNMTGPLSMIIVGVLAYNANIKEYLREWTVYYGAFINLIVIPLILYLISVLIKDRSIVANSVIILGAMPAGAMTSIFADIFDIQREYASVVVVTTTLLSIFTIPLFLKLIM